MKRKILPNFAPDGGGSGGAGDPPVTNWLIDSLPEDQRANESALAWKDKTPADLFQAHQELSAKTKDALIVPGENATEDEKKDFATRIRQMSGVPDTPEGYQIQLPEVVPADDPVIVAFKQTAHMQGLSPVQVQESVNTVIKTLVEFKEAQRLAGEETIKKDWGPNYDAKMDSVLRGFSGLANDAGISKEEADKFLAGSGLKFSPILVKLLEVAGRNYAEDTHKGGSSGSQTVTQDFNERAKGWYPNMK